MFYCITVVLLQVDGKDLFDLPGGTGIVTLKKKIDYDTLTQNKYYSLTITVKVCSFTT